MTNYTPAYFRVIDLSGVPAPDFVEALSYEEIRAAAIEHLVELAPGYVVLESDPAIKVIEAFAYREMLLRQRVNDAARANTITGAVGADLDVLAALVNVARLEGETDDRFRLRVQQGLARLGAAGPRNAYVAHVMGYSTDIIDAGVHSPSPGEVVVTVFAHQDVEDATEAEAASGALLFAQPEDKTRILARTDSDLMRGVRGVLNADEIRPLTDMVVVQPPHLVRYAIAARLVIYPGPDGETVQASARARLASYLAGIRKVGYDATTSGIIAALSAPGVQNVILDSPASDVVAGPYDLTLCTGASVVVDRVDV